VEDAEKIIECDPGCSHPEIEDLILQGSGGGCSLKYYFDAITNNDLAVSAIPTQKQCMCPEGNWADGVCCPRTWHYEIVGEQAWCCPRTKEIAVNEKSFPDKQIEFHCCPENHNWEYNDYINEWQCIDPSAAILDICEPVGLTGSELTCLRKKQRIDYFLLKNWVTSDVWASGLKSSPYWHQGGYRYGINRWVWPDSTEYVKNRKLKCNGLRGDDYKNANLKVTNQDLWCTVDQMAKRGDYEVSDWMLCVLEKCAQDYPEDTGDSCDYKKYSECYPPKD
jgi:hypothetical protein